ncbi:hypothetical protein JCM33374_g1312 [Metschnikowia sp. JCM 33374]|nr:hypothetical protein JCM33374_g1312 [Metschnikowia sp. JCM 33374]
MVNMKLFFGFGARAIVPFLVLTEVTSISIQNLGLGEIETRSQIKATNHTENEPILYEFVSEQEVDRKDETPKQPGVFFKRPLPDLLPGVENPIRQKPPVPSKPDPWRDVIESLKNVKLKPHRAEIPQKSDHRNKETDAQLSEPTKKFKPQVPPKPKKIKDEHPGISTGSVPQVVGMTLKSEEQKKNSAWEELKATNVEFGRFFDDIFAIGDSLFETEPVSHEETPRVQKVVKEALDIPYEEGNIFRGNIPSMELPNFKMDYKESPGENTPFRSEISIPPKDSNLENINVVGYNSLEFDTDSDTRSDVSDKSSMYFKTNKSGHMSLKNGLTKDGAIHENLNYVPYSSQHLDNLNTGPIPASTESNSISIDIGASKKTAEDSGVDKHQTDIFFSRSRADGSVSMGVADGLIDAKRKSNHTPNFTQRLCEKAKAKFLDLKSSNTASDLIQMAHREIMTKESEVSGCSSAAFGTISEQGKVTVSVMGNCGAVLYRDGKVFKQTSLVYHEDGSERAMSKEAGYRLVGNKEIKYPFDPPKDTHNYEWETQPGDFLLFASGDVRNYSKRKDFPEIVKNNPRSSAKELVEIFLDKIVEKIQRKKIKSQEPPLISCFPWCKKQVKDFPNDVSLVIVKIS